MLAVEYWIGSSIRQVNRQTTGPLGDIDKASAVRAELMDSGYLAEVVRSPFDGGSGAQLHGGSKLSIHGQKR